MTKINPASAWGESKPAKKGFSPELILFDFFLRKGLERIYTKDSLLQGNDP
jgi:hypothetical protein